ncbi:hypothetical protein DM02DRAFT_645322 [Periconia macrospinosa]|uniref:Uncharacterized protein n=1 Tax=Periconia macrospinosa TaxID=97972 RepID=A0A2V1DBF4_9PLEO|nr:hypothetical protein DM02DRAFT_645322 [Periconia macrospinosa]
MATNKRSHDALLRTLALPSEAYAALEKPTAQGAATRTMYADTSTLSDDSDGNENESHFVQAPLPLKSYNHLQLRAHLKTHYWLGHGRKILTAVISDPANMSKRHLFHVGPGPADDRSHYSFFQVYDVGPDGATERVDITDNQSMSENQNISQALKIWHTIRNIGQSASKKIVGRITIAREPAPILFGALHLTLHEYFDMDELFHHLVETEYSTAHMYRAFSTDEKHQKTFFFKFEYYTITGEDCKPMDWQLADTGDGPMPLSRCSAVVALMLNDDAPQRIKNMERRARSEYGWIQDLWSSWQVLQIECFPDWRATTDVFEDDHRYLNGPEAFLHALLAEFRDARKRYEEIYKHVTQLITPPLRFLFDAELRDQRLFDDESFTWTRRYFHAEQILGSVNDSIKSMIDSFEETFVDEVWGGKSKTLWPLREESPRNDVWKRRLRLLGLQFEREMKELRILQKKNNNSRHEIESLKEHLFSGSSINESRKSLELSRNIKLLTIVNIFFL